MKGLKCLIVLSLLAMSSLTYATGNVPTGARWIYGDDFGSPQYSGVEMIDTFSLSAPYPARSGDTLGKLTEGGYSTNEAIMSFFEWNYHGSKGSAGAKLVTEDRSADAFWDVTTYDSLVIVYQGPEAKHKVIVSFGEAVTETDKPFVEKLGTLKANVVAEYADDKWKTVSLAIPKTTVAGSHRDFVREVRFVIVDTGAVSTGVVEGIFRLDLLGLKKAGGSAVTFTNKMHAKTQSNRFIVPSVNGSVSLSLLDVNGALIYSNKMNVAAGHQYMINQILKAPVAGMYIAKITGAGVTMNQKMWFKGN